MPLETKDLARYTRQDIEEASRNAYYGFGPRNDVYGLEPHKFKTRPGSAYAGIDLDDPLCSIDDAACMMLDANCPRYIFSEPEQYVEELIWFMSQPENFAFTVKVLFNIELAPFQLFTLQELWRRQFPMLLATRGGGKTWILSLYAMMRAIFDQGAKVVVVGAAFRQSKLLFEYMETFWKGSPLIQSLVGYGKQQGPKRDVDRCNFYLGDSEVVAIPLGDGCVSPYTAITYDDCFGYICDGQHKATWGGGQFRIFDEHYDNGVKPTKIVTTAKGFSYEGTHNHKMRVLRNMNIEWVRTDEMVVGDRILIDRSERWHNGQFECSDAQAYVLGLMIGDGHHWNLDDVVAKQEWLTFWNLQPKCYAKDKTLPNTILSAPQDRMVACLQGLFDTCGHIQAQTAKGITVGFTNTSKRLIEQIQFILLHFGIVAHVGSRDRDENRNTIYELLITGRDAILFADKIGFRLNRKQDVLKAAVKDKSRFISYDSDVYYDEIVSIADSECHTYDIHVPDGHEYCANGFFSHNTKIRGLRAHYTIADEFASIPLEIFEIVIKGFASVSAAPTKRAENMALIKKMREIGWDDEAEAEEDALGFGNQTVVSGTAYYSFNHFYDYWKRYKEIIESRGEKRRLEEIFHGEVPKDFDWTQFSIIRAPHQCLPEGFMDRSQISQAKATVHQSIYLMEYGACFAEDSDGFFNRKLIESCVTNKPVMTAKSGPVQFSCSIYGDVKRQYVYGIDPASEQDNFAIIILEIHEDHRRIVYSWTITRQEMRQRIKNQGNVEDRSFYVFCARKIRDLMKLFPTEHIVIDSQGGGHTIAETLRDVKECEEGEHPLLPYIKDGDDDVFWWEEKDKPTDKEAGEHILHIVNFANAKFIYESNHGLRKDMENKQLLFPFFDPITLANSVELDKQLDREYDTLEDCMIEIEDLKDELSTIIHDQTTSGRDRWDTPEIKLPGGKKGRLRKDRYSALLIANMVARSMLHPSLKPEYQARGGFVGQNLRSGAPSSNGQLYVGPSRLVSQMNGMYGKGVYRR